MVNINTALPPAIAAPFHPAAEALQRENQIKPIIPKTEVIASYAKIRADQERTQLSGQSRTIIQDENEPHKESPEQQQSHAQQRRLNFFATKSNTEGSNEEKKLVRRDDFKLTISVIQERYNSAVTPMPEPTIHQVL
ncbi:hypothetical protein GCM10007916_18910 [Psychromonas marina]|uniref:Uncharacterized protein n=1 Tax=Psychromonas marina TaxID=88364 RepID=A0ABQ6E067_9GAMM|nr:hypothetical protein [Psychromonas marina]GLS90824.1 hypothetical protein GCM10007916_18910 [Psychromonas marina]